MSRILLVEDDDAFRIFCRVALSAAGHQVLEARDGSHAVEVALRERPDLVVLDLWLPGLTGSGVLRVLRANRRLDAVPILVLSGVPEAKDRDGLLAYGADEVVEKPVTAEQIVDWATRLLEEGRRPAHEPNRTADLEPPAGF